MSTHGTLIKKVNAQCSENKKWLHSCCLLSLELCIWTKLPVIVQYFNFRGTQLCWRGVLVHSALYVIHIRPSRFCPLLHDTVAYIYIYIYIMFICVYSVIDREQSPSSYFSCLSKILTYALYLLKFWILYRSNTHYVARNPLRTLQSTFRFCHAM